jgi:hypothetical protein
MELEEIIAERNQKNREAKWDFLADPNIYCLLIFFVLVLMMLSGCDATKKGNPEGTVPDANVTKANLGAQVVALPEPHKYEVRIKWQKTGGTPPRGWFIRRLDKETGEERSAFREEQSTSFNDEWVQEGKTYHYTFGTIEDVGGSVVKAETEVTIPKDLEISGRMDLAQVSGFNRIFFRKNARLITEGQDFTLITNEIYSEDGAVVAIDEPKTAVASHNGRSAGSITVQAKTGSGTLYVVADGENGGSGLIGQTGRVGKKGKEGKIGLATHEIVNVVCNCEQVARDLKNKMQEGGIFSIIARAQWEAERQRHRCISQPTDGYPGDQGGQGTNGGNGGAGGDSAKVFIRIDDPSRLDVKVSAEPGKGGMYGLGGEGGAGWPGGDPGERVLDFFKICQEAKVGPPGPQGQRGLPGKVGADGKRNPVCLIFGDTKYGDCKGFTEEGGN